MNRGSVSVLAAAVLAFGAVSAVRASVIAEWTFETSLPASAGPFSPETGSGSATGSHAGASVYSSPAGNGSSHSFSSNVWAVGDYYQFSVDATGYDDITIQWDQTSSNTGPADFELDWSIDGTNFTQLGSSYTVLANASPNTWTSGTPVNTTTFGPIAGPSDLDNVATVYFRLKDNGTVSANGGTVASSGTDRVDNVIITGTPVPEPATLGLVGLGVMGLIGRRRRA